MSTPETPSSTPVQQWDTQPIADTDNTIPIQSTLSDWAITRHRQLGNLGTSMRPPSEQTTALQSALLIPTHSLLSDKAILHQMSLGRVVICPFSLSHLSTTSYDVTLGSHYYREFTPEAGCGVYNPYCLSQVQRVWGSARHAELHSEWVARTGQPALTNISLNDSLIWIAPGETILGHTEEYIGGLQSITTMMKARSSMGRNFIEVCKVTPARGSVECAVLRLLLTCAPFGVVSSALGGVT
jgi:deoxycytidine triphosphate deaminase